MLIDIWNQTPEQNRAAWWEALESGLFRQGTGRLAGHNAAGDDEFCCLGVMCEISEGVYRTTDRTGGTIYVVEGDDCGLCFAPARVAWRFGFKRECGFNADEWGHAQDFFSTMNDGENLAFTTIARRGAALDWEA